MEHKTPSYDKNASEGHLLQKHLYNLRLEITLNKTLIKDETHSKKQKSIGKSMDFKNLKKKICEPKVLRLLPNVCDFRKENHTPGHGVQGKDVKSAENL